MSQFRARARLIVAALVPFALLGACASSAQDAMFESSVGPIAAEVVADGLEHPWAIQFLPDGRLIVTERPGRIRIIADGSVGPPIEGVPQVFAQGQGGLLDLALAPGFAQSGRLYLSYAEPGDGGAGTAVMAARLVLEGDGGRLEEQQVILRMNRFTRGGNHFGSRIAIAPDGNLFVTLGERNIRDRAQDPADLAGAVVRIAPDGSVPEGNPRLAGWAPELWSKGHRNPQGATIRPEDGALFTVEHGARGGDEVNRPRPGSNYGWPVISYGEEYAGGQIGRGNSAPGYEQPIHYWDPSISPSGADFYDGALFPAWSGDLLTGGLSGQVMVRLDMEGDAVVGEEPLFQGQLGRVRDVRVGPDGAIYIAIDAPDGEIYRIAPAS